jgi:hypothetical protein
LAVISCGASFGSPWQQQAFFSGFGRHGGDQVVAAAYPAGLDQAFFGLAGAQRLENGAFEPFRQVRRIQRIVADHANQVAGLQGVKIGRQLLGHHGRRDDERQELVLGQKIGTGLVPDNGPRRTDHVDEHLEFLVGLRIELIAGQEVDDWHDGQHAGQVDEEQRAVESARH